MRDPELVARAQHAAARLESAWERWRALQGLGEAPAQPVVGYVGYALKEPWGQPRAVIGFSAEEAERLAEFLERGSGDHGTINRFALEISGGTPERSARSHRAPDRSRELAQRHVPEQPATQLPDILAVTSQLSGSQHRHSFLSGSRARLQPQELVDLAVLGIDVWVRVGQAPARTQTLKLKMRPSCACTRAASRFPASGRPG